MKQARVHCIHPPTDSAVTIIVAGTLRLRMWEGGRKVCVIAARWCCHGAVSLQMLLFFVVPLSVQHVPTPHSCSHSFSVLAAAYLHQIGDYHCWPCQCSECYYGSYSKCLQSQSMTLQILGVWSLG